MELAWFHALWLFCVLNGFSFIFIYLVWYELVPDSHDKFRQFGFIFLALMFILILEIKILKKIRSQNAEAHDLEHPSSSPNHYEHISLDNLTNSRFLVDEITMRYNNIKDAVQICAICLTEFQEQEKVIRLKGCSHYFHRECITRWLPSRSICPTCRTPIPAAPAAAGNEMLVVSIPVGPPVNIVQNLATTTLPSICTTPCSSVENDVEAQGCGTRISRTEQQHSQ